jgi:hypothetical protein
VLIAWTKVKEGLARLCIRCLTYFDVGYIVWSRFGSLTPFVLLPAHVTRRERRPQPISSARYS